VTSEQAFRGLPGTSSRRLSMGENSQVTREDARTLEEKPWGVGFGVRIDTPGYSKTYMFLKNIHQRTSRMMAERLTISKMICMCLGRRCSMSGTDHFSRASYTPGRRNRP